MTIVSCPSPELPGPVAVHLEVPDDWEVVAAPGVAFVAASPQEVDGVHVNAVVSVRRIPADLELDDLARLMAEEAAGFDGCDVGDGEAVQMGGSPGIVRTVTMQDPSGESAEKVHQMVGLCACQRTQHVADAVTVTVTYSDSASASDVAGYRRVIESLRTG